MLFGRTNYNHPTRFINEISSDLLTYQGLARPANSSFKASYSSGGVAFGQGMSLAQALQDRKRNAAQDQLNQKDYLLGSFQLVLHRLLVRQAGLLVILPFIRRWGEGTVLEVSGSGSTQELKINFPEVGLKNSLASVAPIEESKFSKRIRFPLAITRGIFLFLLSQDCDNLHFLNKSFLLTRLKQIVYK